MSSDDSGPAQAGSAPELGWSHLLSDAEWADYEPVLTGMVARQISFALGGGFAFSTHTCRWRQTKDMDLYILRRDRERVIGLLNEIGYRDFHDRIPYDRGWIYRGFKDDVIVDLIWATANYLTDTDPSWFARAAPYRFRGLPVLVLSPEDLLWAKLYVLQRDRCDWPDSLNILWAQADRLDWPHLLERLGDDARLLGGLLATFAWIAPDRARLVPEWVWSRAGLRPPAEGLPSPNGRRVRLLDARDWFGPNLPCKI